MSATLFKEVNYSLAKLVEDIDMGEIGLPELQRPFVWPNTKVRDLFDSMYKGFPVGYLLFWANGMSGDHHQIGTEVKQKAPRLLIVDGQQRLTSLYAVLKGVPVLRENYRRERVSIAFRPSDQTFEVTDAAIRRDAEFIADISDLWAGTRGRKRFVEDFVARLRERRAVSEEEEDRLWESVDQLYDLQSYPFTALELSPTVNEEEVAEVFVRVNSKGTLLNQADFILTLMSVFWDEGRADLERFCGAARQPTVSEASPFNHFIHPDPDQLLRVSVGLGFRRARLQHVYSLLRGKDLDTGEFSDQRRVAQFGTLRQAQSYVLNLQNWHEFLKVPIRAGYRYGGMITSQVGLLYAYTTFLLGKRDYDVDPFELRNAMARWFFMTALTGRYTSSPESVMEQDLASLRSLRGPDAFVSHLDGVVRDTFTDDYWRITLPNELATASPRSPSLFAYYAALNLLDANVLFSKMKVAELLDPATKGDKSAVERHHLFAKAYLASLGRTETRDTNQIANYALVEWPDNIAISGAPPSEYFPEFASRFSSEDLEKMRYWHALPADWETMDYDEFLRLRRVLIADVIRDGFGKLSL